MFHWLKRCISTSINKVFVVVGIVVVVVVVVKRQKDV